MSTRTMPLPAARHERVKTLARSRGVSVNKLVEEWATVALTQQDSENRYRLRARRGRPEQGLALLDELDRRQSAHRSGPRAGRSRKTPPQAARCQQVSCDGRVVAPSPEGLAGMRRLSRGR